MAKNSIELYKIGSKVKLTDDVHGIITAICIHGDNHVTYECGWWSGRSYNKEYFSTDEIEQTLTEKTKIGFLGFEK
jgi:hypothetical protein